MVFTASGARSAGWAVLKMPRWAPSRQGKLGSVAMVMTARALVLAANMATGLILAAMLGPQGRGVQSAMGIGAVFTSGVSEFGLHASMIYNVKADPPDEDRYVGCALLLGLLTGLTGAAIAWLLIPLWLHDYPAATILTSRLLLVVVPIGVIFHLFIGTLETHGKFSLVSVLGILFTLMTLVSVGVLWALGRLTPTTAAMASLLPTLPICLIAWLCSRRVVTPRPTLSAPFVRRLLRYGLRFYGIDLLASVGTYLDQLLLVLFLAPYYVGIYAVALSAARIINMIPMSVLAVLFPTIAARSASNAVEIVGLAARVTGIIAALAAAAFSLVGPYLIHLLYGPRFAEAIDPFRVLLAQAVVDNLARILYQAFSAVGRPEIITAFELIGVVAAGVCMLVLVPHFGMMGAAWSLLLMSTVRLGCVLVGIPLILHVNVPRLMLNRADILRVLRS